jgi:hypothetical protein
VANFFLLRISIASGEMLLVIALVLFGLFLWCHFSGRISHIRTRDIACSQVCDLNNPGAMTICSTGKGTEAKEACNVYYTCVKGCRARQSQQLREKSLKDLPINPEESWGSRYSHLITD